MQTAKDFSEFYNSELKSLIVQHEKERKNVEHLGSLDLYQLFQHLFVFSQEQTVILKVLLS